ncbi:hypothetical protein N7466_010975 [Penicillium verhagenii]|uniref:uncharacterized protein n=1 Tax=Penicillium verhagenii TaxID=1562060 RepID=UPI0025457905|nr:uncharacterized protein N7466_010975 [Penicillium verhagenii]KAJ5917421.1 hypothetical protein N7466_010975 [Penicillium verhagenii]
MPAPRKTTKRPVSHAVPDNKRSKRPNPKTEPKTISKSTSKTTSKTVSKTSTKRPINTTRGWSVNETGSRELSAPSGSDLNAQIARCREHIEENIHPGFFEMRLRRYLKLKKKKSISGSGPELSCHSAATVVEEARNGP